MEDSLVQFNRSKRSNLNKISRITFIDTYLELGGGVNFVLNKL